MNKVIEMGRLVRDPELRYTAAGVAVCNFNLAVDREYKSENPESQGPYYFQVVAWRTLAEIVANNLKKGRKIQVEGKLQVSTYNAEDGSRRYVTSIEAKHIEFLDYPKKSQEEDPISLENGIGVDPPVHIPDAEIPF